MSQSQAFFEKYPHIEAVPCADTAQAARFVHEEQDVTKGVLAGPQNGALYHLEPLLQQIQSEETNTTRFFLTKYWRMNQESIEKNLAGDYVILWNNLAFASEYLQLIGCFKPITIERGD